MTRPVVLTGAGGFLGWHVRVLARALRMPEPIVVTRDVLAQPNRLASLISGADRVIHMAGINRGEPSDVAEGNVALARQLTAGLRACGTPPKKVVYANSIQAGNGTPYGDGKATAAVLLAETTRWFGSEFEDVLLPNLFGEHGRPNYNSVIATFCRLLADGGVPQVTGDRELDLLHITDAAAILLGVVDGEAEVPMARRSVTRLAEQLTTFADIYRTGEIPPLGSRFDVRLFNTYRSQLPPAPLPLAKHTDARGGLVEAVKVHGGGGQTFCSSTVPGVTRGQHFHLAKVERFVVVRGDAEICLRRVLHDEVLRFRVSGDEPVIVDMPTMWAHNITNVGDGELTTLFWSNDLFDPVNPDTYPEPV
ncbi:polysaccharide biosynthesis C-terminal domain-containing protein [Jidongwangia harbinensis]|uniref:polysaccharide biosynthesis C-terminal domain-containing protein n=1 Tax=Jidongwangia harbinensis TaxID=2878561 RepID=UPI001CD9A874|nr:NAD-dependent epimerase/dehydratase family protein [Jidongwangia harbinensis]MCA2213265.1 NAD-dependent epimerase/dehydratase family protein [Jidongwangia harbinensis]